jgi:hypothetical protein|tara:strand:- start:1370 stop:1573 length:204 start_codon:yes stop_codon:yes gene_type:complete
MNRHIYIKSLFLLLIFGLAISCADQKTEAAQNTIESDLVSSVEKDRPNGITTLVVTGNVHGQLDPCG